MKVNMNSQASFTRRCLYVTCKQNAILGSVAWDPIKIPRVGIGDCRPSREAGLAQATFHTIKGSDTKFITSAPDPQVVCNNILHRFNFPSGPKSWGNLGLHPSLHLSPKESSPGQTDSTDTKTFTTIKSFPPKQIMKLNASSVAINLLFLVAAAAAVVVHVDDNRNTEPAVNVTFADKSVKFMSSDDPKKSDICCYCWECAKGKLQNPETARQNKLRLTSDQHAEDLCCCCCYEC
ncbi:hypothetical protein BC938DRAFT_473175 [Jimgerdemannia flammicorona]|uniref:Uncharacterized protein n=1 Tax=Jimgerdemannia flammicorona TaxID=994334 RepID=A0A433Q4V7_9FUNG|nr:hypothetical protein BC938DRAFT_473175 [Jimgerdemannia flammicorona]